MIVSRRADSLPDWSLVQGARHMWIFRIDPLCAPMIGYLARPNRPNDPVWPIAPYEPLNAVLPDPPPSAEASAIMNLASAGFTIEMISEEPS